MKKGFTLVELLAVIVILAIIAVIAVPQVLKIIGSTKDNATITSANFYLDAVEVALAPTSFDKKIGDGVYNILENGNICLERYDKETKTCIDNDSILNNNELKIKVNGEMPTGGTIKILNDEIESSYLVINDKELGHFKNSGISYIETEKYMVGTPIYFNVSTGDVCKKSEAVSAFETKKGCMEFYVIKDYGGALDLILNHNTTQQIEWTNTETATNANGPINLLTQLYEDTKTWKGTLEPASYSINLAQTGSVSNAKYEIVYTGFKARIITAKEVADLSGQNENWDETSKHFKLIKDEQKIGWLFDRTNANCKKDGCLNNLDRNSAGYGYLTISAYGNSTSQAWGVTSDGSLYWRDVNNKTYGGVRPVITISKSILK